jgi:hypothetical protein
VCEGGGEGMCWDLPQSALVSIWEPVILATGNASAGARWPPIPSYVSVDGSRAQFIGEGSFKR